MNDVMPSWSNHGDPVDYVASGVGIFSLWKDGDTRTISGTSMAAPHACAVLMLSSGSPNTSGTAHGDPAAPVCPIIHWWSNLVFYKQALLIVVPAAGILHRKYHVIRCGFCGQYCSDIT
jgi:subtilisin family serine protease